MSTIALDGGAGGDEFYPALDLTEATVCYSRLSGAPFSPSRYWLSLSTWCRRLQSLRAMSPGLCSSLDKMGRPLMSYFLFSSGSVSLSHFRFLRLFLFVV